MDIEQKFTLGGFDAIFDSVIPGVDKKIQEDIIEDDINDSLDDDELKNLLKNSKDPISDKLSTKKKDGNEPEEEEDDLEPEEDIEDEPKSKSKKIKTKDEEPVEDNNDPDDIDDESSVVTGFFDSLAEKLGWELNDEDEKPKDVETLIKYFQDVIEEESKPEYASDEIEALDAYIKQGGDLKNYLTIDSELDIDNIDITDEDNQKVVVKKLLKEKGFSDARISKMITKYEDAGILEDEATDAIEDLKEINQQKKEQLLKEQKKEYDMQVQRQQEFCSNVVDGIKGLKDIRGIVIPEKDKRVLMEYILKPDSDGKTKYQKDYAKNGVKGLIESAYFTMNADKLVESAKKAGSNSAIDKFKQSLRNNSINTKSKTVRNTSSSDSIWDSVTRHLRV